MTRHYEEMIDELGRSCAREAWHHRTVDVDGETIVPRDPQEGDFLALSELIGREIDWSDPGPEIDGFSRAYRETMDDLVTP